MAFTEESSGFRRRKSHADEQDIDVTPLVDCVFLLLSFFMVSSTMKGNPDHAIPSAAHGVGVDPLTSSTVRIVAAEPAPQILLNDHEATLDDVRPFVEEGVQRGHMSVIIKADREVQHGFVQRVARAANSVNGVKIAIGVQDKKQE